MALQIFSTVPDDVLIQIFTIVRFSHLKNTTWNLADTPRLRMIILEHSTISCSSDPRNPSPRRSSIEKSLFVVHAMGGLQLGIPTNFFWSGFLILETLSVLLFASSPLWTGLVPNLVNLERVNWKG